MKKNKNGFTLIEILVVIAIISLLALGIGRINLNPQIDSQKSLEFANIVQTNIEEVRNNSLFGKGMGTDLIHPDEWIIKLSNEYNGTNTGSFVVKYNLGGTIQDFSSLIFPIHTEIKDLVCYEVLDIEKNNGNNDSNHIDIIISGSNLSLSGCTNTGSVLDITIGYKNNPVWDKTIELNTVSGLIQKK